MGLSKECSAQHQEVNFQNANVFRRTNNGKLPKLYRQPFYESCAETWAPAARAARRWLLKQDGLDRLPWSRSTPGKADRAPRSQRVLQSASTWLVQTVLRFLKFFLVIVTSHVPDGLKFFSNIWLINDGLSWIKTLNFWFIKAIIRLFWWLINVNHISTLLMGSESLSGINQ